MNRSRASLSSRFALLAAVTLTALLGDLRVVASPAVPEGGRGDGPSSPVESSSVGTSMVSDRNIVESDEEVRLVPAIYAWNPEVRFVYYRHVSKWM